MAFARRRSPYYRRLYAGLPEGDVDLTQLPVTTRSDLMGHFDEWLTERGIGRAEVEEFVADRRLIGERFRGRYLIWKSSGSSGTPGLFLQDPPALAVYDALVAMQWLEAAWSPARFVAGAGRAAIVIATGDHYASIASWERLRRSHPAWTAKSFSVLAPIGELVAELNDYRPALLATYPSMLAILAGEMRAGRLRIAPSIVWCGGEALTRAAQARAERLFGCRIIHEYGASECLSIAHGCRAGSLHLNQEWVLLEAVESDGSPTPPGRISHTTLLTNLANRLQPLIRYDLGDRVLMRRRPCACGNALPALFVEGRSGEVLELRSENGSRVPLSPLAIASVVEEAVGGRRFQLAQAGPTQLVLRLDTRGTQARRAAWQRAGPALRGYLQAQGLGSVRIRLGRTAPRPDAHSGKLRQVVIRRP